METGAETDTETDRLAEVSVPGGSKERRPSIRRERLA